MDKFAIFQKQKSGVAALLEETSTILQNEQKARTLREKAKALEDDKFVISVFGHFSNGKSTFLNALMGFDHEVLKEEEAACTATITVLRYAEKNDPKHNSSTIYFNNGQTQEQPLTNLNDFIAKNKNIDVEKQIEKVVIYTDSEFLKNGVEIVDTPGFNSTYTLHDEIAIKQVERSNAAIFLFNCEKPGAAQEIDFLKRIRRYMDRVFFVMNKYDRSQGNEIDSVQTKLANCGIDASDKTFYPLKSKIAKRALMEKNDDLFNDSGMPQFKQSLSDYLLSGENIKDRLYSPLKSLEGLLTVEKDMISERISIWKKDSSELDEKISTEKDEIEELEEELKSKQKNIKTNVADAFNRAKKNVSDKEEETLNYFKDKLKNVQTQFDITINDLNDYDMEAYDMFKSKWNSIADTLLDELIDTLNKNIDDEDAYKKQRALIFPVLKNALSFEYSTTPEKIKTNFDFSVIEKENENVKKLKKEYDDAYDVVTDLYADKADRDERISEIERLRTEGAEQHAQNEKRLAALARVNIEYGYEEKVRDEYVKRSKIGQFFLGDKRIERPYRVQYVDSRQKENADKEAAEIRKTQSENDKERQDRINELKKPGDNAIDRKISKAEQEFNEKRNSYFEGQRNAVQNEYVLEQKIVNVGKDKLIRAISDNLNDIKNDITRNLRSIGDEVTVLLMMALEDDRSFIEDKKYALTQIAGRDEKTPEQLEAELLEMTGVLGQLNTYIGKITQFREEINNENK